jgi:hypothetical protein
VISQNEVITSLASFHIILSKRYGVYLDWKDGIEQHEGGYEKFTRAYEEYGIHTLPDGTIKCKEWAPGSEALYLTGDFSKPELFNLQLHIRTLYSIN